jgi:hemolysin III
MAIALIASGRRLSPTLGTCVYLAMGWGAVVCYARIARVVSHRALGLVVLGGLLYSVGAVLNLLRWPALWPGVFGVHDLFHLFVMAGSLAHYWFILKVVVPFGRRHGGVFCEPGTLPDNAAFTTSSSRSPGGL